MNKMTFDTVSLSSDDDDVPLRMVGASTQMHPLSVGLKTRSCETCEFCEVVSYSRYDALIHNAKHIIIPLLKQKVHQCSLCLYYFTSRYKLKHHIRNKHKNDVVPRQTTEALKVKQSSPNVNDKPNHVIDITGDAEDKNIVNNKSEHFDHETKSLNNKNHVNDEPKLIKDKSKDADAKVATKYDSDDDDEPLVQPGTLKSKSDGRGIKETEKRVVRFSSDAIQNAKEKLIKDVKVVLKKIEPEVVLGNHNVHKTDQLNIDHTTKAEETESKSVNNINKEPDKPESILKTSNSRAKISSRLRFEDELDICDDEVIKDLTTDCIVDMNLFDEPWLEEIAKSITDDGLVMDDIVTIDDSDTEASTATETDKQLDVIADCTDKQDVIADCTDKQDVIADCNSMVDVEYPPSTHHEELIKPGVYRCKRCPEMFPTRFNQIQHEMTHIRIRKPRPLLCEYCDRFIATKKALQDHIASKHQKVHRTRTFKTCNKCNLKYNNYQKHLENYHVLLRCHLCNKGFETEVDRLNHIRGHLIKTKCEKCDFVATNLEIQEHQKLFHKVSVLTEKTFNLCELCCLFLKNNGNNRYVFGETVSEIGTRLGCEHCGNKFFHLTQVKRYGKGRPPGDRITFEKEKEKKKKCSNTERLKNIQQRLKMINKLSRF